MRLSARALESRVQALCLMIQWHRITGFGQEIREEIDMNTLLDRLKLLWAFELQETLRLELMASWIFSPSAVSRESIAAKSRIR